MLVARGFECAECSFQTRVHLFELVHVKSFVADQVNAGPSPLVLRRVLLPGVRVTRRVHSGVFPADLDCLQLILGRLVFFV